MRNDYLLIEGPDGAGKSTLCDDLRLRYLFDKRLVVTRHHGPYLDLSPRELFARYRDDLSIDSPGHRTIIADRSWISERCYGEVIRGGGRLPRQRERMLERLALGQRGIVVVCLPPYRQCKANLQANHQYPNLDQWNEVYRWYQLFVGLNVAESPRFSVTHQSVPVVVYDYTAETVDALVRRIEEQRAPENPGPGIGNFKPGVDLLVGDRANLRAGGVNWQPFVTSEPGLGCSDWLTANLERWGVPESALYWANSHHFTTTVPMSENRPEVCADVKPIDTGFIAELRPRKVIALGNNAGRWCVKNGVDHVALQHPQHHARFRRFREYPLMRELLS